jgi:hypothetical protein
MVAETVFGKLGKWVGKPLEKLPRELQPIAKAYIPKWNTLTSKLRTDRAIEVDRQRALKSKIRLSRAERMAMQANRNHVQEHVDWHDVTLEAEHWATLSDIAPVDAAMLLCRFNPNETSYDDAKLTTTDELKPEQLVRLAQRLADHKPRTLREWHQTAKVLGLTYHSWIDGYMEATTLPSLPLADTAPPEPQAAPDVIASGWNIKRPQRFQGYGYPLFKLLTAAHIAGKATPTARDVIDAWEAQKPPEVIKAYGDGLKYYDAKGNTKAADLDAIRQAINRMID